MLRKLIVILIIMLSITGYCYSQSTIKNTNIEANRIKAKESLAPPVLDTIKAGYYLGEIRMRRTGSDTAYWSFTNAPVGPKWKRLYFTPVSGKDIKTINNESIIGPGNINISGTGGSAKNIVIDL